MSSHKVRKEGALRLRNYPEVAEARGALAAGDEAVDTVPVAPRSAPGRTIDRRRPLPGGRALLGGFLVAVAIVGTFTAYTRSTVTATVDYVVAARDIDAGATLRASDLTVRAMTLPAASSASV